MAAMVNMTSLLNGKDSRWLQLEVCREFQRNKCSRQDTECKFAHPPANVEVQNGKVTACYDSIKGRCNRDKPPCKYFHPPQHLKDQLLINGRNHLALKNALMQQMGIAPGQPVIPGQVPAVATNPYLTGIPANTYSPYFAPGHLVPALLGPDPSAVASQLGPVVPQAVQVAQQKIPRSDRLEVCREFVRGACKRAESECRFAHPQDTVARHDDGSITVCMDAVKGRCTRDPCRYFHPPLHLQAQLKAAHSRATAVAAAAATAPVSVSAATLSHHHQQQHHLHQQQLQHHLQQQQQQTTTTTTTNTLNGSALMATQQQQQQQPHHQQQQQQQTNMANAAAAAAAANAAAVAAMSLGQQHPLEVGKKRAADTDMFQLAYSGMVPIKRPAAEKSGIPVYPGATTYQQLMQLQQPFVPVSSSKKIPINASYVIYTDESGQLLDTLPVCQDFNRSMCSRLNCRFVHLTEDDKVEVCDQRVAVCRDHANGQCRRKQCKYYHIPIVLPPANIMAALINGNHNNSTIISSNNNSSINNNNNNSNITNLNTQHNQLQTTQQQQQQQQQQHDFEQHILQQQQKVATTCGVMPAVATTIATTNYNNNLIIIEPHHQQSPQQQQQHPHHHQQQQQQQQHFYTPATISYTTQHHPQQATTLATPKVLTSQSSQLFHATPTTHITTVPHIFHTSPHQQQQQQQQQQFQQLQYTTANTTAYQGSHPHQQMPQHTIQHQTHHHHPHQHHQTHHHITSPYSPSAASTSSSASSSCSKACSPTLSTTTTHSTTSTATIPTPMAANYLPLAAAAAPLPPSNTTNYLKAPPPPPPNAATAMTLAIATQAPLVLGCSTLSNSSYSTNCIPILTTPPDVSALAGATTLSHHHHHHQTGHATAFIYPATAQPQH